MTADSAMVIAVRGRSAGHGNDSTMQYMVVVHGRQFFFVLGHLANYFLFYGNKSRHLKC